MKSRLFTLLLVGTLLFAGMFGASSAFATRALIGDLWYELDENNREARVVFASDELYDASGNPLHNNYIGLPAVVDIPESVDYEGVTYTVWSISNLAFHDCDQITTVNIPKTVTVFDNSCFIRCPSLKAVNVDAANPTFSSMDGIVYANDMYLFCYYPQGKDDLSHFTIPATVVRIRPAAFQACLLDSVFIPNTVNYIDNFAFANCKNLRAVRIGYYVHTMGQAVFAYCNQLREITIPVSVTTIGLYSFADCFNLTKVTINSPTIGGRTCTTGDNMMSIFGRQVKEYVLAEGITQISEYAFRGTDSLQAITIPSSVESIGTDAFEGCDKLKTVKINSQAILNGNFNPYVGTMANIFGSGVETYILGDAITSIAKYAFYNCSNITTLRLPEHITSIGESAFKNCTGLAGEFVFPEGLEILNYYVLQGCTGITSVKLPNTLKEIYYSALAGCSISTLTLPASLTGIDIEGLYLGHKLTSLTCLAVRPPELGMRAFQGLDCPNTPLYVPEGSVDAYKNADQWKTFNPILPISNPQGVEEVSAGSRGMKVLRGGRVTIERGDKIWTISGQEIK